MQQGFEYFLDSTVLKSTIKLQVTPKATVGSLTILKATVGFLALLKAAIDSLNTEIFIAESYSRFSYNTES